MAAQPSLLKRLLLVIIPTQVQALAVLALSFVMLTLTQVHVLLGRLGVTQAGISLSGDQFHEHFDGVLQSAVAGQVALITFWASVGLVAYLLCWAVYNLMIELRNDLTIEALYTNRGPNHGPGVALMFKLACAAGLALVFASLWLGVSLWVALFATAVESATLLGAWPALAAIIGFAIQLYVLFAFVQLTFTPWYRVETFTQE